MITAGSSEGLYGIEAGAGTRGVVLVHGSGSRGLCNWSQELGWLPGAGFHVLAYDQSCVGESGCDAGRRPVDDILAVVAYLRGRGARTVTVVGASAGGPAVLVASSRPGSGITAAVSLSAAGIAEPLAGGGVTAAAAARSIRIPVLYALARDDAASSVAEVTALHRATKGSRLSLLPAGAGHAQAILYDATGQRPSPFRAPFLRFLHRP